VTEAYETADRARELAHRELCERVGRLLASERRYQEETERGMPVREFFERAVRDGRKALRLLREFEARGWNGSPTAAPLPAEDIAGMMLGLYDREATNGRTAGWTVEETDRHWAAADEFVALAAPEERVRHLTHRATQAIDQGRAHRALYLADRAASIPRPRRNSGSADFTHGDPRAVLGSALRLLYDPATALHVLEPLKRELEEVFAAAGGLPGPLPPAEAEARLLRAARSGRAEVRRLHHLMAASSVYEQVLDTWAAALRDMGRSEEAEEAFHALLPSYAAHGLPETGYLQLAGVLLDRGATEQAERYLDLAAPLFRPAAAGGTSLRDHARVARGAVYCRMRAEVARARGCPADALEWCDRGETFLAAHPDRSAAAALHTERARARRESTGARSAVGAYRAAVEELSLLLRIPLGHRFDTLHLRFRMPTLREALAAAREAGDAGLAALVTDLLKARAFAARLALSRGQGASMSPIDQAAQDDRHREFSRLTEKIDRAERTGRLELAAERRGERAELLTRIRAVDPRWQLFTEHPGFDAARLTAFLRSSPGGRCAALSLYEQDGSVLAVLATPERGLRMGVRALSSITREALERHAASQARAADFWADSGVTLADLVPGDFADEVADSATCLISPYGRLHHLPWTVVRHRGRHLVRGTAIGVVPNLASIPLLGECPQGPVRSVALVGVTRRTEGERSIEQFPHLPRAIDLLAEGVGTGRLYGPPRVGADATVAELRKLLQPAPGTPMPRGPAVLCLAAHAGAAPGAPFGGLVQMGDGEVTTGEVALGRLPFTEVVLPACSTGYRPVRDARGGHGALAGVEGLPGDALDLAGDEATSLVHAFHEAGAAFVLASPFTVHDTPAIRFSLFWFQYRLAGRPPLEAARRAAVAMLDHGMYRTEHWAGITAYGAR
jgi:tetratricopeptide (TPR) repeat protein